MIKPTKIFLPLILVSFSVLLAGGIGGQADNHVIKVGYYMPSDARGGVILGYQVGKTVDERVSFGFGADLYVRSYVREVEIDTANIQQGTITTKRVDMDFSTYMLPMQANVIVSMPMDVSGMSPYMGGGLGYAMLLNREVNYISEETDLRFFSSFIWNLTGGLEYELGRNSAVRFELFYNRALMRGNRDKTESGFPVYDELNMSGLGLRFGLVMEL